MRPLKINSANATKFHEIFTDSATISFLMILNMQETSFCERRRYIFPHRLYRGISIPISKIIQILIPSVHFYSVQWVPNCQLHISAVEPDRCTDGDPLEIFVRHHRECILHLNFHEEDLMCTSHFRLQFDLISKFRKEDA